MGVDALNSVGLADIIGWIIAFLIGVVTLYISIKFRGFSGNLCLAVTGTIELFDEIVRNLSNISILYDSEPISDRIVFIRAALVNSGIRDISKSMIYEAPSVSIPSGYRWIGAQISVPKTNDLSSIQIVENKLVFNLDFLRSHDHIAFEALIEIPQRNVDSGEIRELITKNLALCHRISDIKNDKVVNVDKGVSGSWGALRILGLFVLLIQMILAHGTLISKEYSSKVVFEERVPNTNSILVTAHGNIKGEVSIAKYGDDFISRLENLIPFFKTYITRDMSVEDFDRKYRVATVNFQRAYMLHGFFILLEIVLASLLLWAVALWWRTRSIYKILPI